jgi:hypothetical protein
MDWAKLLGFCVILFMAIEILKFRLSFLKPSVMRVVSMAALIAGSFGLAYIAPVAVMEKNQLFSNAMIYFIVEYFLFLFLHNELKISMKDFLLSRLGIDNKGKK